MGEKENVEPDKPKPIFDNPSPPTLPPADDRDPENEDKPDGKFYAIRTDSDQFIKANADFTDSFLNVILGFYAFLGYA